MAPPASGRQLRQRCRRQILPRLAGLQRSAQLDPARMQRVSGYADRKPAVTEPADPRNNRIEIILLRRDR